MSRVLVAMSGGVDSSVAALLLQADPTLTQAEVEQLLTSTAFLEGFWGVEGYARFDARLYQALLALLRRGEPAFGGRPDQAPEAVVRRGGGPGPASLRSGAGRCLVRGVPVGPGRARNRVRRRGS